MNIQKGYSTTEIVDFLEEPEEKIKQIAGFIAQGLDDDEICKKYIEEKRG
ncbi:MAG: hypothetical protein IJ282_02850 [Lachnospiraceae bacterium]|nr:hypothetical protein [Lachnospiraceae bacterium]